MTATSDPALADVASEALPSSLAITRDVFLGDRLTLSQPLKGYRAGVDAVLLAASVRFETGPGSRVLDVGAGVGTVGLCVAARLAQAAVVLYERAPELVALAQTNIAANGLLERVAVVAGDVAISSENLASLGLSPETFDCTVANPPFHDVDAGICAADPLKAGSHAMAADDLDTWVRFMARMLRPGGRASMIHKAEALPRILKCLEARFGGITVLPVMARAGEPAIRVLVEGTKGSRAPLILKSPFVLQGAGQSFTPEAEAILRHGAGLTP